MLYTNARIDNEIKAFRQPSSAGGRQTTTQHRQENSGVVHTLVQVYPLFSVDVHVVRLLSDSMIFYLVLSNSLSLYLYISLL